MKRFALVIIAGMAACAAPNAAMADALQPVNEIMTVALLAWSDNPPEDTDYFSDARLAGNYSAAFVAAYRAAQKFPAYEMEAGETAGYPFDYDVITNSQDGCPLKDIKAEALPENAGVTAVKVTFRLWDCAEDEAQRKEINELRFEVINEDGKPVISDIKHTADGEVQSLMSDMLEIAKGVGQGEQ